MNPGNANDDAPVVPGCLHCALSDNTGTTGHDIVQDCGLRNIAMMSNTAISDAPKSNLGASF